MFVHLGGDTVIRSKDIIAILDRQAKETSEITQQFLDYYEEKQKIEEIAQEVTKSIVVTTETIYLSPISSSTLKRRAVFVSDIDDI